jgi:hypothetical protein
MNTQTFWKRWMVGGAAALALTDGTIWTVNNVSAADVVAGISQSAQEQAGPGLPFAQHRRPEGGGPGGYQQDALLANALGITEAELQTTYQEAFEAGVAQAVEAGTITQAQADQILNGPRIGGGRGLLDKEEQDALLADALGITVEELEAARDSAITEGVEAGLLTQAQANDLLVQQMIRDAVEAARAEALQQAVEQGLITQSQADNMLNQGADGFGRPQGFGGHGRGGGRGFGGPQSQEQNQPTAPSAGS